MTMCAKPAQTRAHARKLASLSQAHRLRLEVHVETPRLSRREVSAANAHVHCLVLSTVFRLIPPSWIEHLPS